ncbi:MAG: hypothetical protein PVF95_11165 [bacterium]|jgi:hypothetical protein
MRDLNGFALLVCLALAAIMVPRGGVLADWQQNGIPIAAATGEQYSARAAADGTGGIIFVWNDGRAGDLDIRAQRVDVWGDAVWGAEGVPVCSETGDQRNPQILPDGFGGALIAWYDRRTGSNYDVYAQRIDATGTSLWAPDGVPVCQQPYDQDQVKIAPDGSGGMIIVWRDDRAGLYPDIYAQRVDASGTALWDPNGAPACTATYDQEYPEITSDGAGGAIMVWVDTRSPGARIYGQRLDAAGGERWPTNGVPICTYACNQFVPRIVADGAGGAVVAWEDERPISTTDIYAQRVDSLGALVWDPDGRRVCTAAEGQYTPAMTSDGAGGAIIAWMDYRPVSYANIYAQRMSAGGSSMWAVNGVAVGPVAYIQGNTQVVGDGDGGVFVVWEDDRSGVDNIYAQRLNAAGTALWAAEGISLASMPGAQISAWLVADDAGGAVACWMDDRVVTDYDVYAQRVGPMGYWGQRMPDIHSVRDIPGDQGGQVDVAWYASPFDTWMEHGISHYTVWRAVTREFALLAGGNGALMIDDLSELAPGPAEDVVFIQHLLNQTYFWNLIMTVEANFMAQYSAVIPTLFDSTSVCEDYHYFQVVAHSTEPYAFWASGPDSGRSVDNLAPGMPLNLAGDYQTPPGELLMTWDPNMEEDLSNYAVYRGASEGFVPDETNRIGAPVDTFFVDTEFNAGAQEYYKVSALDIHENESGYALLRPEDISGVDPGVPLMTALEQNVPNPFSPETAIRYSLAERGHVLLKVYDVEGRPVRTLVDGERAPERYEVIWGGHDDADRPAAPGVYFYKLEAPGYSRTMKMVLLR